MNKLFDKIRTRHFFGLLIGSIILGYFGIETLIKYFKSETIDRLELWTGVVFLLICISDWAYFIFKITKIKSKGKK